MNEYLTDNEKAECKKIMNAMIDYWFSKVLERMARGETFEKALNAVREEIINE